jgi:hypothetical protein
MPPLLSAYKEVKCPDGPRFILKEPEKAFSIHAPDWEARVKTLEKCLEKIQIDVDVEIKKKAKSIVKELTENYATLQAHYQAAYLMYASNPCNKKSEEECQEAMKEIRDKTFILSELETKTRNISSSIATVEVKEVHCPKCGAVVSEPKKAWMMVGRPDKSGKPMALKIGSYECKKGHKFRQVLQKRSIMPIEGRETNALLSKQISEVEKLVSKLKK